MFYRGVFMVIVCGSIGKIGSIWDVEVKRLVFGMRIFEFRF